MILNEVAFLNERSESWMDTIVTDLGKLERDVERGHTWSGDCTKAMRQMEVDIGGLMAQQAFMRGSMDKMRGEMDALLHLNGELVRSIVSFHASIRHGRDNPIVIKDDDEAVDTTPVDHSLVEIIEETLEREVVDDREESPEA